MLVTMAASSNEGTLRWLNKDFLLETMDWVNVMTYDMAGDWTDYAGHNAPLFASSREPGRRGHSTARVVEYLLDDLRWPADHVALGIPLYGRGFAVKEPYASTKGAPRMPRGEGGRYSRIAEMLAGPGWKRVFDDETKVPWLIADDGHAVIGYDDAESTTIKGAWARSKGLRGVFFWEVAGDRMPDGSHPLQEAARRGLFDGDATPPKITSER
jgi:chitinase